MNNKAIILKLYNNRYTYAEIGRMFNLSRQRVHQIVTGYNNTGVHTRKAKYKEISSFCATCGGKRQILHHIDGNNQNDKINNLLPLCRKCHVDVHTGRKPLTYRRRGRWSEIFEKCQRCKLTTYRYQANGLCSRCYEKSNKCKDCEKYISNIAVRCMSCAKKGDLNPMRAS